MNTNYAAIIMDVKQSRKYDEEERFNIQEKLFIIIKFINNLYKKEIVKEFDFSSGDSIQALFNNTSDAFSCYCLIKNLFYPYKIRCGIGYGKINQKILDVNYNSTNMLDGDAYHYAIFALNNCKGKNCNFSLYSSNNESDNLVNQIMSTVELLTLEHSIKQADVFDLFNLLCPLENKTTFDTLNENIEFIIMMIKRNLKFYELNDLTIIKSTLLNDFDTSYEASDFSTKINSICAQLLNVSRQNIEKIRHAGFFDKIRKLEQLLLNYIRKEYKGD